MNGVYVIHSVTTSEQISRELQDIQEYYQNEKRERAKQAFRDFVKSKTNRRRK